MTELRRRCLATSKTEGAFQEQTQPCSKWWKRWWRSFIEQLGVILQHFPLTFVGVVSIALMSWFLEAFSIQTSVIKPILHTTDTLLIFIFCFEAVALLGIIVFQEIRRHARPFREPATTPKSEEPSISATDSVLREFQLDSLQISKAAGLELESARFIRDVVEMPNSFGKLSSGYGRCDAVSQNELAFWLSDTDDAWAREYFDCGMAMARDGKDVTRLFLLSGSQLKRADILVKVLERHLRAGIGIAVVPFEELPPDLRRRTLELDFALWDYDRAFSVFRHQGGLTRQMAVVFSNDGLNSEVDTRLDLYRRMLEHAWLVDEKYIESHAKLVSDLSDRLKQNNIHVTHRIDGKFVPEGEFFILVGRHGELRAKVSQLSLLWNSVHAEYRHDFAGIDEIAIMETRGK